MNRWDVTSRIEEYVCDHFTVTLAKEREEAPIGTGKGVPKPSLQLELGKVFPILDIILVD